MRPVVLMFVCAPLVFGMQSSSTDKPAMEIPDSFFQKIGWQLIHPPSSSVALLQAAAAGKRTGPEANGERVAIQMAKSWIGNILRPEYQPPQDAVFVAIPREAGLCDVVRVRYLVRGERIEVAQTFSMFSVSVEQTGPAVPAKAASQPEHLARLLLAVPDIGFTEPATLGGFSYAKQKAKYDPFACDWWELLRWWSEGNSAGFVTVKTTKAPHKAVVGPGEETNTRWFDLY
jgi:hypothetical protein